MKAQLNLIVLSRATSLVSNGNNITSLVSLTMEMCQILSASTTLSCRIGLIFCIFQGGRDKSEAKTRKTRGKREKSAKHNLREREASQKNPACPHSIVEAVLDLHANRASRSRHFRLCLLKYTPKITCVR